MRRIGVLALQGDVVEHRSMLSRLGIEAPAVRTVDALADVDGLIMPGGESTTIGKLMTETGLDRAIAERIREGMPVYGTCAGMILLARVALGGEPTRLGAMDITVRRNAYGRQAESFETELDVPALGAAPLHAVFIRAPMVERVGPRVLVLASHGGRPVLARERALLVSSFHPELTADLRVHRYFAGMADAA